KHLGQWLGGLRGLCISEFRGQAVGTVFRVCTIGVVFCPGHPGLCAVQQPVHLTLPKERVFRVRRRWRAKVVSPGSVQVTAAQVTRTLGRLFSGPSTTLVNKFRLANRNINAEWKFKGYECYD
ncbi:hypothetical protein IIA28_20275, partial [candidate division KSB1 bacterium]|nr:hypothetical protein [candidate division KSB1 bacterium]